jgi:hypothetical protein
MISFVGVKGATSGGECGSRVSLSEGKGWLCQGESGFFGD